MSSEALVETPLHDDHVERGARMVDYAGYHMPVQFSGVTTEHQAVRSAVGLFDVSHMGRLRVRGDAAAPCVNRLITNDLIRIGDGRALYTCACDERGGIVDDLIVYRQAESEVMVVCNAANRETVRTRFQEGIEGRATLEDVTEQTCLIAVQGPRSLDLIELMGAGNGFAERIGRFSVVHAQLAGHPCRVARTGYTGEDGVEIFCAAEHGVELWRELLSRGAELGVQPVGLAARDTLRLEACLPLYGNEIGLDTNPFEAKLGWTVKLDKGDFVGRDALVALREAPRKRRLAGFEMTGRGIARHGYRLLDVAGDEIGRCTSGAPSPTLGKSIGLGYLPPAHAGLGSEIAVDCRGRRVGARVVETPFYRRPG